MALGELERSLMHYNEKLGLLKMEENKQRINRKWNWMDKFM